MDESQRARQGQPATVDAVDAATLARAMAEADMARLAPGPDSTRQERLTYILWANRALIAYYVHAAFDEMPPLVASMLRGAGRMLKIDVETQFPVALEIWFRSMPAAQFEQLWQELGAMLGWVAAGRPRAEQQQEKTRDGESAG